MPHPNHQQYMEQQRQQQFFRMLAQVGQGILAANRQGQPAMRSLAAGMAAGMAPGRPGGGGLIPGLRAQGLLDKTREEQEQKAQYGGMLHSAFGGGLDETTGIDWNTGRIGPGQPTPGLLGLAKQRGMNPALLQGMLQGMGPKAGFSALAKQAFASPQERYETVENPYGRGGYGQRSTKTGRISGYQTPAKPTMSARKLALLNKYRAAQDGKANWTAADQAEWDMIIQADPMDIMRRNILQEMGRTSAASTPAPGAPAPPAASGEEPGFFERGYDYLFGDGDAAAATTNPSIGTTTSERTTPRSVSPRGPRGRLGRARQKAKNPPRLSNGGIDRSLLVPGQAYLHPVDGQIYRWTGTEFVLAR